MTDYETLLKVAETLVEKRNAELTALCNAEGDDRVRLAVMHVARELVDRAVTRICHYDMIIDGHGQARNVADEADSLGVQMREDFTRLTGGELPEKGQIT